VVDIATNYNFGAMLEIYEAYTSTSTLDVQPGQRLQHD